MSLKGKNAVVYGAGGSIGSAVAAATFPGLFAAFGATASRDRPLNL